MSLALSQITHPNCHEIALEGYALSELDFEELNALVDELISNKQPNLILNLKAVKILNSLGINTLIKIYFWNKPQLFFYF